MGLLRGECDELLVTRHKHCVDVQTASADGIHKAESRLIFQRARLSTAQALPLKKDLGMSRRQLSGMLHYLAAATSPLGVEAEGPAL
jgi:hypothetical protein